MSNATLTLTTEAQKVFTAQVQAGYAHILGEADKRWQNKPTVANASWAADPGAPFGQRIPYRKPSLHAIEIRANIGYAAFVIEEQIDYDVLGGAELRHELFVMTLEKLTPERKHSYESHQSDGEMFTEIKDITTENIVIETAKGMQTIATS